VVASPLPAVTSSYYRELTNNPLPKSVPYVISITQTSGKYPLLHSSTQERSLYNKRLRMDQYG
jgi:hypothetical protein